MARVNLSGRAIFKGCIPVTWFTPYSGGECQDSCRRQIVYTSRPLRSDRGMLLIENHLFGNWGDHQALIAESHREVVVLMAIMVG